MQPDYKKMVVFTAPSGAGKTTLVRHLLEKYDFLDFSISACTREKRAHEINGKDYYFISPEEFKAKIEADEFIEFEEVYENQFYGTLRSEVDRIWNSGKAIVFDIDVKGAVNIKKRYKDNCLTVFVKPPSFEVLVERLRNRNTETEASLKKRITRVKRELSYETDFDTVVVNDLLEVAKKESEYLVENFILGKPFID
ncbi:MAG: guanylate kinase [Saprospiraceae bacterium]|nr:guanylate kinase [Saprospiraceae bacterium]